MNRRTEPGFQLFWKRLTPRYLKMITTLVATFIIFNVGLYMSIKYFIYPVTTTLTTESTTTEPTTIPTTTTLETTTTTEQSFSKLAF